MPEGKSAAALRAEAARRKSQPSRRRVVARRGAAAVAIVAMIAVPGYLLFVDDESSKDEDLVDAAADPGKAAKVLSEITGAAVQGIAIQFPSDWTGTSAKGVVRVTSEDKSTHLAVTSRGKAADATQIFKQAVQGIALSLKGAKVSFIPTKKQKPIAGLPAAGAVVLGRLNNGTQRNVFVSVVRGRQRAYVVTILTPENGGQLGIANLILARGLTLTG